MQSLRKKSSKKISSKRTEARSDDLVRDVTIDDFANTSRSRARFKKAATNISSEGKQEATLQVESRNSWSDAEGDSEIYPNNSHKVKKNNKGMSEIVKMLRKSNVCKVDGDDTGIDYPLDLWFLISEYISPEAVGKFARICRSSYHVTTTGKFWFHLYKSYYRFVPDLPERLQPQCMVRTHGLRACVIRALYYTYFALKREVDDVSYLRQAEPHSLIKRRCCLMWHKKGKVRWYFFFKLKEERKRRAGAIKMRYDSAVEKTDFLETIEDVAVNPEEGCKVLRVTCLKYSMLPPVIGLILLKVSMTLMPGFKDYKLQLGFGTSDAPSAFINQVILNDVINCQILDWWHPPYPHQDGVSSVVLPQHALWD